MMHRAAFVVATVGAIACGAPAAPKPPQPPLVVVADAGAIAIVAPPPALIKPPPSWVPGEKFVDVGAGKRGAVASHRRVVLAADGKATVVDDAPVADLGPPRKVPTGLGGGWVFIGTRGSVAYAKAFDGPLVVIVPDSTDFPGFTNDRVFVKGSLFALSTGKSVPPLVPDTVQVFGLPSGQTTIRTKSGDIFFSPATGKPFVKVTTGVDRFTYDGSGFVLWAKTTGERWLALDGKVGPVPKRAGSYMESADNAFAFDFPDFSKPPPMAPDPDRMVAPLSVAMADGTALRVEGKDLHVFDGKRGVLTATQKAPFGSHDNCTPLRGGTPAFVGCNSIEGMTVFRIDAPDHPPVLEKVFKGVYAHDVGFPTSDAALALARRCDGSAAPGVFCVRHEDGSWNEVGPIDDPQHLLATLPFLVSVAASKDGAPYAFGFQNGNGPLVVEDGNAKTVYAIPLGDMPAWAQTGLRWSSVTASGGRVRLLVPGERPGLLTIDANGKIETRAFDGRLAAVGARGLLLTPDGKLRETTDAGTNWDDVDLPPGGADPLSFGCEETGCAMGPWLRLGWSR